VLDLAEISSRIIAENTTLIDLQLEMFRESIVSSCIKCDSFIYERALSANSGLSKAPGKPSAPLVGLLAIIERYWATDFLQSFSYAGTATTPPPLRSSHLLGALNAAGTGDSARCAAEALNRLLAIEGEFLGSLQYALLGVVIQSFVGATSRLKSWSSVSWFTLDPWNGAQR